MNNPGNPTDPSVEELFNVVTIDRPTKKKMTPELSLQGEPVPIQDTVENLTEFIEDMMKNQDDGNVTRIQTFPLMAKSMVFALHKLLGPQLTWSLLSQETVRYSLIHMLMVGFYLMQFVKKNGIKINTLQEALTDEDIEMYDRVNAASNLTATLSILGADPKEVIQELLREGAITREDLKMMGAEEVLTEKEEDKKERN